MATRWRLASGLAVATAVAAGCVGVPAAQPVEAASVCLPAPQATLISTRTLAPGITLETVAVEQSRAALDRLADWGYLVDTSARMTVMTVDLRTYRPVVLSPRYGRASTTAALARTRGVRAAINGDLFYGFTGNDLLEPMGPQVTAAGAYRLFGTTRSHALVIDAAGRMAVGSVWLRGTVRLGGTTYPLRALNTEAPATRGLRLYDRGDSYRAMALWSAVVRRGRIVATYARRVPPAPRTGEVVVASDSPSQAARLRAVRVGARASAAYTVASDTGLRNVAQVIGAGGVAARGGVVARGCTPYNQIPLPRSEIGWSADGTHLFLASFATTTSETWWAGGTLAQLARALVERGASTVVAMDGGGSTTLVARASDALAPTRLDMVRPSAYQRPVPNALGVAVRTVR